MKVEDASLPQLLRCQYLYFGTIKASNLNACRLEALEGLLNCHQPPQKSKDLLAVPSASVFVLLYQ
jgi:hypothetical protein